MAIVTFSRLGAVGLISDVAPHTVPLNGWSDARNVHFLRDRVEYFKGHSAIFGTPSIDPYHLLYWSDTQELYWFYANASAIYRTDGTTHTNVTRTSGGAYSAGTSPRWNGGVLGGVPILNHTNFTDYPQEWDSATEKFKNLTNWPAATYAKVIRPFKNFLIAYDVTESGVRYPTTLRWSHPADPGAVPSSWDFANPENDAGRISLSETTGFIIDALPLGDVNVVYKEDSTWFMRHTGGVFIFQLGSLFKNFGLLTQNCVAEFMRRHFVVGLNDVWVHDGQTGQSIIDGKIKDNIYENLDSDNYNRTFTMVDKGKSEIWICFPSTGSTLCDVAAIWNWRYNTWTMRDLPQPLAFGAFGTVDLTNADNSFDASSGTTFDLDTGTFGERSFNPAIERLVFSTVGASKAFYMADGANNYDGVATPSYVERTGLMIAGVDREGKPIEDQTKIKFCRGVFPEIEADADAQLTVSVGAQSDVNSPVVWYGPYTFDPATQLKVDCTVAGRYLAVRFNCTNNKPWKLTGYKLDVDLIGVW